MTQQPRPPQIPPPNWTLAAIPIGPTSRPNICAVKSKPPVM
ncbi:MAG: hypothetical protein ABL901_14560 [Hyphomicrobiaceae bacterium]